MSFRTHGFKSPVGDMRQTPPRRNSRPLHPQAAAARRRRRLQWKGAGRPAMLRGRRSRPGRADAMGTKKEVEDGVGVGTGGCSRASLGARRPSQHYTLHYASFASKTLIRPQHVWLLRLQPPPLCHRAVRP
jgi:hypothetical protein